MSVVFTTISDKFIAMCADKQRIIPATGETKEDMTKIEKWTASVSVGMSGNLSLGEYIRSTVHRYITENGIDNFGVEGIADLFCQHYNNLVKDGGVAPSTASKFIIAGKFSSSKFGAVVINAGGESAESEVFEASKVPATLILEPEDLSAAECNMLLGKALKSVEGKYLRNPLESIHRRAVRNVSEHSKFTGKDSDFLIIIP